VRSRSARRFPDGASAILRSTRKISLMMASASRALSGSLSSAFQK
jgi:hypothetical protein